MNLFQELRERRVPQIISGYVVGGWGLLQFLAFLEGRMRVAPDLVNLVGLGLLLALPSVATLAWVHGRPGRDAWGRAPKIVVPANVVGIAVLLFVMFQGRELGAVTRTIEVEDENGAVVERVVPTSAFRQRVLICYPTLPAGADSADVSGEVLAYLVSMDISQDPFVDTVLPLSIPASFRAADSEDGRGLSGARLRKIARDAHIPHYLTGELAPAAGGWELRTRLNASETGRIVAERTFTAPDLMALTDRLSRQVREDLGVPAAQLEQNPDLPVVEMTSADPEAVRLHVRAVLNVTHANKWDEAVPLLQEAVKRDEGYALAQFLLFGVSQSLGQAEVASQAIGAAMANLYKLPERLGFLIKAQYYFNEKHDAEKAAAVVDMWARIYPDDVGAYEQMATFAYIRQDLPAAVAAHERILAIDPARVSSLEDLADLHTQLGDLDKAEGYLKRYIELNPTRADGYENLSDFYSDVGRLDDARDALSEALLLEPENGTLAMSVIDLDIKMGAWEPSEQVLKEKLTTAGGARETARAANRLVNLGMLLGRGDMVEEYLDVSHAAILELQNPLQANLVYTMMLPSLSSAGRPDAALARMAAAREAIPAPFTGLAGVGQAWVLVEAGRPAEARAALAEAVVIIDQFGFETFRSSVTMVEAMIAEAEGDIPGAVTAYREALDEAIKVQPFLRADCARALRRDGQLKEAAVVLDEALKVEPAYPQIRLEAALLAEARRDMDQARDHLDAALAAWSQATPGFQPVLQARELAARLAAR
ncbi:tetratricopeptide repeat protein [bacterium]|nr:tetratricopeptide repeat protein [bacterium]